MKTKATKWLNAQIKDETTKAELDIINFLKRLVRETAKAENGVDDQVVTCDEINSFFEKTYSLYPRKVNKVQARTTFEHKLRGMKKDEAREKALKIYYLLKSQIQVWEKENDGKGRKLEHTPHFSSWCNGNVDDSPQFAKRRK